MARKFALGLGIALLSMGGTVYVILHYAGGYHQFWALANKISPGHWVLLFFLTALFYLMDYARYYTLFALCGVTLPLSLGIQMTCVSYFVSTLTPGSELYIPAVIFLAGRKGIPASKAAAVTMIKPFYLTVWVCLIGFASLWLRKDIHLPSYLANNLAACLLPFGLLVLTFAYVIFCPERFLRWSSRRLTREAAPWWEKKGLTALSHCAETLSTIGRSAHPMHLAVHVASLSFIVAYSAVGGVLAHALGMSLSPGRALAIFSNSLMVCYLAPSPAGMGLTEVATSYLLDPQMSHMSMVIGTLLRFLCWYIVVIPGALILTWLLNAEGVRLFLRERRLLS